MIKVNRGQLLLYFSAISMGLLLSPGPYCVCEISLGTIGELDC